jgi:hypothetical protein
MSNLELFVVGTLVTLLVCASMTLLIWGAVLDGRDEHDRREEELQPAHPDTPTSLRVVDAA